MRLLDQFESFEALTATTAIPRSLLYIYYGILFVLYLFFLRGLKPSLITYIIMVFFNAGFIESFWGSVGMAVLKVVYMLLLSILLSRIRLRKMLLRERIALAAFLLYTILFYLNYLLNGISVVWGTFQYFKYFFPVSLYFAIIGHNYKARQNEYYARLILKLLIFQVLFSVVKLLVLGFRENIVGSLTNTGGSIGLVYAVLGIIILWAHFGGDFKGREWIYVLSMLLLPIASSKRATWFIIPVVLFLLLTGKISKTLIRNVGVIIVLLPAIVYFGFRLNPTLNPERRLWGSFDPGYAVDYAMSYSGVSEDKLDREYAQGRWGAGIQILKETISNPFSRESLLGWGRSRSGRVSDEFDPADYGLRPGTMIAGFGTMIIRNGWPAMILVVLVFLHLIATIPNERARRALGFYVLWDVVFYGGAFVNSYNRSVMLILTIWIVKYYTSYSKRQFSNGVDGIKQNDFQHVTTAAGLN